MHEYLEI